jgi:hypothetical protein
VLAAALAWLSVGCERREVESAGRAAAESYLERQRNNVIENWQSRVRKAPECANFAEQYAVEGKKHASAASGKFVTAMQRVRAAAVQANCIEQ